MRLKPFAYDKLSPIQIRLGYLVSDFRQGVAKYYNQIYPEAVR